MGHVKFRPGFRDALTLHNPVVVATASNDELGVSLTSTGNPDLKPEKTTEWKPASRSASMAGSGSTSPLPQGSECLSSAVYLLGLTETFWDNLGSIKNAGTELNARFTVLNRTTSINLGVMNTTLDNDPSSARGRGHRLQPRCPAARQATRRRRAEVVHRRR